MNKHQLPPSSVQVILSGDGLEQLADLPVDSVPCCLPSPSSDGVAGQTGLEQTLEDCREQLVQVFRQVRHVLGRQLLPLRGCQTGEPSIAGTRGVQVGLPHPLVRGRGVDAQHAPTVQLSKGRHDNSSAVASPPPTLLNTASAGSMQEQQGVCRDNTGSGGNSSQARFACFEPSCQFVLSLNWLGDPTQVKLRNDWRSSPQGRDFCRYVNTYGWRSYPMWEYRPRKEESPPFAYRAPQEACR